LERRPQLIVVGGPNGVGKSTYSRRPFAAGFLLLDPDRYGVAEKHANPLTSGRVVVSRVREALSARESLVLETTLSGAFPLNVMKRAKRNGYGITLLYIGVDDADECVRRVRRRVALGGHDVPEADVRRRYSRSMKALPKALELVDRVSIYDNAVDRRYRLVVQTDFLTTLILLEVPSWATTAVQKIRARCRAPAPR